MSTIVEMTGVNKFYGSLQVLKDVGLSVEKGEVMVVIGPSGSGKSTLIRCVNGLEVYQQGEITVDGFQMPREEDRKLGADKELAAIRKGVGMVFQQ
ncbi:MAG: ATP-binding cassette domain-containing protein, partial [Pseudaminobacter sp.]